ARSLLRLAFRKQDAIYRDILDRLGRNDEPMEISTVVVPAVISSQIQFANCEGRAARAFLYLAALGVRPLEIMSVGDDHAFVVVGRTAGAPGSPAGWNDDAAICDPWANDSYLKGLLNTKLGQAPLRDVVGDPPVATRTVAELAIGANLPPF